MFTKHTLIVLFSLISLADCSAQKQKIKIKTKGNISAVASGNILPAADRLDQYLPLLKGKKVAFLVNQTSMVGQTHLVDTLKKKGVIIKAIFGPEHGFRGAAPDGAKISNAVDPNTGAPVISLYGTKNKPSPEDLKDVDVMVYDIQDVGTR
ncbi:MAG: exo-beta-N-acetylmuramidase NamZ domain-containing protein, partial [Candidatus Dadabacteria bacterium]